MSLRIESLRFRNFRSYESFELGDIGGVTVFVGENAVGKTNIIEGIQLLTALSSFRNPKTSHLIREGASSAFIEQNVLDGPRELRMRLDLSEGKRAYSLNGKSKRAADLKGMLPSVVFTPDDLDLVKGSQSNRRAAIDAIGSQLTKNHYVVTKDYEKVLKHKNRLLKEEADSILLENINDMMVTCGAQLSWYRSSLVERLAPYIRGAYYELSDGKEQLDTVYHPSWLLEEGRSCPQSETFSRDEAREKMRIALDRVFLREQHARKALVGPHVDRIEFFLNGKDAGVFGSQGQQRSIVLAYKIAELLLIQDVIEQKPVLLLDDVMSELDTMRREKFISLIEEDIQTFITTTHLEYFSSAFLQRVIPITLPR